VWVLAGQNYFSWWGTASCLHIIIWYWLANTTHKTGQARIAQNLREIQLNWHAPLDAALPKDILPPRISFHTSRSLAILSGMKNLTTTTQLLTREMLSRKQRTHGRGPNYFTNSDVRLAVHTIINAEVAESLRPSLIPAEINGDSIQVASDALVSPLRARVEVQISVPAVRPASNLANLTPPGCRCPIDILEQYEILQSDQTYRVRKQAFDLGVKAPLSEFCWHHIRPYFRIAMGFLSNSSQGRANLEARITALHQHFQAGGTHSDFVNKNKNWFNADTKRNSAFFEVGTVQMIGKYFPSGNVHLH